MIDGLGRLRNVPVAAISPAGYCCGALMAR